MHCLYLFGIGPEQIPERITCGIRQSETADGLHEGLADQVRAGDLGAVPEAVGGVGQVGVAGGGLVAEVAAQHARHRRVQLLFGYFSRGGGGPLAAGQASRLLFRVRLFNLTGRTGILSSHLYLNVNTTAIFERRRLLLFSGSIF